MMNLDTMDLLLLLLLLAGSAYSLYTWWVIRHAVSLPENKLLCPTGFDPRKCGQPQRYLRSMRPLLLLLGAGLLLCAGAVILEPLRDNVLWQLLATVLLPLLLLILYVIGQRKAAKQCW